MRVGLLIFLFLCGCGSTERMRGHKADQISDEGVENFAVSARVESELSQDSFHVVDFYFRNLNPFWLRVTSVEIVGVEDSQGYSMILGEDLKTWLRSMMLDIDLKEEVGAKKEQIDFSAKKGKLKAYTVESHLLGRFSIPPKMQSRRWGLLQIPKGETLKVIKIKVNFIDSRVQSYRVMLKEKI